LLSVGYSNGTFFEIINADAVENDEQTVALYLDVEAIDGLRVDLSRLRTKPVGTEVGLFLADWYRDDLTQVPQHEPSNNLTERKDLVQHIA
jgi:hypothetical protein